MASTPSFALRIPEHLARPLGRGASDLAALIGQFVAPVPNAPGANPNVERSLAHFARLPELASRLRRLPDSPVVLIQGYSDPGNAGALDRFLAGLVTGQRRMHAIDLYDLPAVYELLKFPPPAFEYRLADASDLRHHYADRSVDVLVQDFLLNCAPCALHILILREVARILSADGVALISFSDRSGVCPCPTLDTAEFQQRFGRPWQPEAYNLTDMFPSGSLSDEHVETLKGSVVHDRETGTSTLATRPTGRFEFFRDAEVMLALFAAAGLEILATDRSEGVDSQGLHCVRYRCLLTRMT